MVPKKMFANTTPVKLRPFWHSEPLLSTMLYAGTIALADMGMVKAVVPVGRLEISLACRGMSDSPKSTVPCWK